MANEPSNSELAAQLRALVNAGITQLEGAVRGRAPTEVETRCMRNLAATLKTLSALVPQAPRGAPPLWMGGDAPTPNEVSP